MIKKIEIGNTEKHLVEYFSNPYTGVETIKVDGKVIFEKFCLFGMDKEFEIGQVEKIKLGVKSGLLEQLSLKPLFFINGQPYVAPNIDQKSPLNQLALLVGMAAGGAWGYYAGINVVLLVLTWAILASIFLKAMKEKRSQIVTVLFSGSTAYVLWLVWAALMVRDLSVLGDILIFGALAVWVLAKASKASFITTLVLHGLSTFYNAYQVFVLPFGTPEHKGVSAHLFMRVCLLVCAAVALIDLKKRETNEIV